MVLVFSRASDANFVVMGSILLTERTTARCYDTILAVTSYDRGHNVIIRNLGIPSLRSIPDLDQQGRLMTLRKSQLNLLRRGEGQDTVIVQAQIR